MFSYLHSRIRATASVGPGTPPPGLMPFYWHFTKQTLCLRLQRGGGVRGWGRDGLGTGA
jgi:hypothetical protein